MSKKTTPWPLPVKMQTMLCCVFRCFFAFYIKHLTRNLQRLTYSQKCIRVRVNFQGKETKAYLVNFPSKKTFNFLVLVIFSGKTKPKKSLKVNP